MFIKKITESINNIDIPILHIMKNGVKFSIVFLLIATLILTMYCSSNNLEAYYIGTSLLKSGIYFCVSFIICGCAFEKILNEIK